MNKAKILIVEDEMIIANNIADILETYGYFTLEPAVTYSEALQKIKTCAPDMVVIDIHLSGRKNGVDLAKTINEKFNLPFIFLTSNADKSTINEATLTQPFAYLIKPFSKDELFASIELAFYIYQKQKVKNINLVNNHLKNCLFIKDKNSFKKIYLNQVTYIESDNVNINIFLNNGKTITIRKTLNDFEKKLDKNFMRIHRKYIVNMHFVEEVNFSYVIVNNFEIPLGVTYKDEVMKFILK